MALKGIEETTGVPANYIGSWGKLCERANATWSRERDGRATRELSYRRANHTNSLMSHYIIESLKLPESISAEEQLGPLKRKYGFEINEVRAIVKEYKNRK